MKKPKRTIIYVLILLLAGLPSLAQTKAITDTGDEVILYENGTWKYTNEFNNIDTSISINPTLFTKSKSANFLLKSNRTHLGIWLDPKSWNFNKAVNNVSAEYEITSKDAGIQLLVIPENISISLQSLKNLVIKNARNASPDFHIIKEEYRNVNGANVLYLESEGTVSDILFSFYGYYYTDATTALQLLAMTIKDKVKNRIESIQEILNGMVVINAAGSSIAATPEVNKIDHLNTPSSATGSCQPFFAGKWNYTILNQRVNIDRTVNKTIEKIGKYTYEYETKWIDNCKYQLLFTRTDDPDYKIPDSEEPMIVEILSIDKNTMNYKATYFGKTINNEMERSAE